MKTLFRLFVFVLLVTGWGLAALSLHAVRTPGNRIVLIPKQSLGVTDTYVDASTWTMQNVPEHVSLVRRILQSGKSDHFAYMVGDPKHDVARQLDDALRNAPQPQDELKNLQKTVERKV